MKTNIRDWVIAFAVTSPLAALIYVGTGVLGPWLPRQIWFANLILP